MSMIREYWRQFLDFLIAVSRFELYPGVFVQLVGAGSQDRCTDSGRLFASDACREEPSTLSADATIGEHEADAGDSTIRDDATVQDGPATDEGATVAQQCSAADAASASAESD